MRASLMVGVLLLPGCVNRHDLEDVLIHGGTVEQQLAAIEELATFERWIGPDRVRLSRIEFREIRTEWASGAYYRTTHRIRMSAELPPDEVRRVLRHELCHALDDQENLLNRPEPALEAVVSSARTDPDHPLHHVTYGGDRTDRAEVFAELCEQAPLGTALLAHPCPQETDAFAEAARWIADQVWTAGPDVSMDPVSGLGPSVSWDAPGAVQLFEMVGSEATDAAGILPYFQDPDQGDPNHLDVFYRSTVDAAEVPRILDFALGSVRSGYDTEPPVGVPDDPWIQSSFAAIEAVSDGETTLRIARNRRPLGAERSAPHVLVGSEGGWSLLDGACPTQASSVFLANGQLYVAWAEGPTVSWAPFERDRAR